MKSQRKVFLSFLGTGAYTPCNYVLDEHKSEDQEYVQISLLETLSQNVEGPIHAIIFLTKSAKEQNWQKSAGNPERFGLHGEMETLANKPNFNISYQAKDIADGFSQEEVWSIFQEVYESLEPNDEIYLDVTHAFRYIPMLCFALLNYARTLKGIFVKGIFYGAFEKLGYGPDVRNIPLKDRNVSILRLDTLDVLQQWTNATTEYIRTGRPEAVKTLVDKELKPRLSNIETRSPGTKALRKAADELTKLAELIDTNRIQEIAAYPISSNIFSELKTFSQEEGRNFAIAFQPLIGEIEKMLAPFEDARTAKWLAMAQYSLSKKLYPQTITQLQEGIISEILEALGKDFQPGLGMVKKRQLVSEGLAISAGRKREDKSFIRPLPEEEWKELSKEHIEGARQIQSIPLVNTLANVFQEITRTRNDIQHGGITNDPKSAKKIKEAIETSFHKVIEIFREQSKLNIIDAP